MRTAENYLPNKKERRRQEESRDQITHYRAVFSFYSSRLLFSLTSLVINAPTLAVSKRATALRLRSHFFFSQEQNTFNEPYFLPLKDTRVQKKNKQVKNYLISHLSLPAI